MLCTKVFQRPFKNTFFLNNFFMIFDFQFYFEYHQFARLSRKIMYLIENSPKIANRYLHSINLRKETILSTASSIFSFLGCLKIENKNMFSGSSTSF